MIIILCFPYQRAKHSLNISFGDVQWLCQHTSLPVILKGVLTPEDVKMAIKIGVKAVIVSNHGGR